jgi:hypothetical protein
MGVYWWMTKPTWIIPSFRKEKGEIERVAKHLGQDGSFVEKFLLHEVTAILVPLTDEIWGKLENTDSDSVKFGAWNDVAECAGQVHRDWQTLRDRMVVGSEMDAPIIYQSNGTYHLVSGNTRLMVAKALGITPQVVIVEQVYV